MADDKTPLEECLRMLALVNERFDALERQMVLLRQTLVAECIQTREETVAAVGSLQAHLDGRDFETRSLAHRISYLEGWDMSKLPLFRRPNP